MLFKRVAATSNQFDRGTPLNIHIKPGKSAGIT